MRPASLIIKRMSQIYRRGTIEQRLANRTEIDPLSGCHIWQGACNPAGYPLIRLETKTHLVHRLAWTLRYGTIPDGMQRDNMRDMRDKRRARTARGLAVLKGECGLPDARPEELTPMRMFVRGV